jgi:hypothetical protein
MDRRAFKAQLVDINKNVINLRVLFRYKNESALNYLSNELLNMLFDVINLFTYRRWCHYGFWAKKGACPGWYLWEFCIGD